MTEKCEFVAGLCIHCGDAAQGECEGWNAPDYQISTLTARVAELEAIVNAASRTAIRQEREIVELEALAKDAARLDWLDAKGYGWIARDSTTGRGYRLHQSVGRESCGTAREAIDKAIEAAQVQHSERLAHEQRT